MRSYLVSWSIDIDAENPQEAAEKALEIQRNPDSIATTFDVVDVRGGGKLTTVDLGEGAPPKAVDVPDEWAQIAREALKFCRHRNAKECPEQALVYLNNVAHWLLYILRDR